MSGHRNNSPFFLNEAVISLYPAGPDGRALVNLPVWLGVCAGGLKLNYSFDPVLIAPTGSAYKDEYHVDETNMIEIERLWAPRRSDASDFKPVRNQRYVMEIVWESVGYFFSRTYYGVTARSADMASQGVHQSNVTQIFRAQYFTQAGGSRFVLPADVAEQSIGFFHEQLMLAGDYFIGAYRFGMTSRIKSARVVAWAPQTTATVLQLEIDGILINGATLTIPVGTPNTEVTVERTFNVTLTALSTVRWKIISAPDAPEDSAWHGAMAMQLQPQPGSLETVPFGGGVVVTPLLLSEQEQSIGFFHENLLLAGNYLLGIYRWAAGVTIKSAKVISLAPQTTPTVLQLEVNGALISGAVLTIPVGAPNTHVSDELVFTHGVPALSVVRWKIISAPDAPEDSAWHCGVAMQVVMQ